MPKNSRVRACTESFSCREDYTPNFSLGTESARVEQYTAVEIDGGIDSNRTSLLAVHDLLQLLRFRGRRIRVIRIVIPDGRGRR